MLNARPAPRVNDGRCATVPERIAAWARLRPTATAVVDNDRAVTYGELRQRIDILASRLQQLGVRRDDPVAVYLERSVDCVVAAAAVLTAGAAYLMLDPRQPTAWNRRLLDDSSAGVVITRPALWESVGAAAVTLDVTTVGNPSPSMPFQGSTPEDALAYVSYTSGSTGNPKGVLVEHAGLANLVEWYLDRYQVTPDDHLTQLARPSFDAFALEVWPCLSGGATLHVVDTALLTAPTDLRDWIYRTGITVSFVPTPLAEQLLDLPWPRDSRLRDMLVGGDQLSGHPDPSLPFRLHNNYGPTECSVVATCCEVASNGSRHEPPPIGKPIPGVIAYVLDRGRLPVAEGEPGELHLGGIGVARGYLGSGHDAFWPDPFHDDPGARIYATGDLVRRSPDGQLHFLGRVDDQIQIRGFRVEPAEVESVLHTHSAVAKAVVLPRPGSASQLRAFVVPREDGLEPDVLREFLTTQLPDYMVPAAIVLLDQLPQTRHGKIDRHALAELPLEGPVTTSPQQDADPGPATYLERVLAELWAEILDWPTIKPSDSFFEIGGDSLRVIRLISKCKRRGISLLPEDVYAHPVLRDLAIAIHEQQQPESGNAALSPTETGLP